MQCVETRECGGLRPPDSGPCTVQTVLGPCDDGGGCDVGECQAREVCSADAGGDDGGCGCRAVGAGRGAAGLAVAALALGLALWRRR